MILCDTDVLIHVVRKYPPVSNGLDLIDALIAQTAIALDAPLHTFNVKHFELVSNLRTIQPYQR